MVKPSLKTTSFKHHPVYLQKVLHVDNPFYGIKPQYQRAEVPPGGNCEVCDPTIVTGYFYEETSGQLDVALQGSGRVGTSCVRLTQTAHTTATAVYLRFADAAGNRYPINLQWARYVGMWIRAGDGDVFTSDELTFYIFTRKNNYSYANRAASMDFFEATYTDPGGGTNWYYIELDLSRLTKATGYETDNLSEVWGIGWYSADVDATDILDIDQIEFYTHGTGYGPARGNIISIPLEDGAEARTGYAMAWAETAGRANVAIENEPSFAGICVGNPSETALAADVGISAVPTTITVLDASLFETGTCQIWDDDTAAGEPLTITAVNRVTNVLTVAATVAAYTTASHARLVMLGNDVGSIKVDVMIDGIANMLCFDAGITAQEGVSIATGTGTAPDIDDGGGTSQGIMIGKATEAGETTGEVIPVLLGMPGTTA
jgi:hypothetical protein